MWTCSTCGMRNDDDRTSCCYCSIPAPPIQRLCECGKALELPRGMRDVPVECPWCGAGRKSVAVPPTPLQWKPLLVAAGVLLAALAVCGAWLAGAFEADQGVELTWSLFFPDGFSGDRLEAREEPSASCGNEVVTAAGASGRFQRGPNGLPSA